MSSRSFTKNQTKNEENVIFGGRLAEYKYYDMDDVIRNALDIVNTNVGN